MFYWQKIHSSLVHSNWVAFKCQFFFGEFPQQIRHSLAHIKLISSINSLNVCVYNVYTITMQFTVIMTLPRTQPRKNEFVSPWQPSIKKKHCGNYSKQNEKTQDKKWNLLTFLPPTIISLLFRIRWADIFFFNAHFIELSRNETFRKLK